jgi:molybdopterin-guanine dinucleotide biosynthesis protein A
LDLEGFVLAGGASTRYGSDKALARREGRPLVVHALSALRDLGVTPRLVTRDPLPHQEWGRAFVLGERPGLGPAEGLRAALEAMSAPWALVLAVDMPGVDRTLLCVLLGALADSRNPVAARAFFFLDASGRRHPFPGLYHREALDTLDRLSAGASLQELLEALPHRAIGPGEVGPRWDLDRALRNVNRPQDL